MQVLLLCHVLPAVEQMQAELPSDDVDPATQLAHCVEMVAPVPAKKVLVEHAVSTPPEHQFPDGHAKQEPDAAALYWPFGQFVQDVSPALLKVPAEHPMQLAPEGYWPAMQSFVHWLLVCQFPVVQMQLELF